MINKKLNPEYRNPGTFTDLTIFFFFKEVAGVLVFSKH